MRYALTSIATPSRSRSSYSSRSSAHSTTCNCGSSGEPSRNTSCSGSSHLNRRSAFGFPLPWWLIFEQWKLENVHLHGLVYLNRQHQLEADLVPALRASWEQSAAVKLD